MMNEDKLEANYPEEDEEDGLAVESGDEALDAYDEYDMVILCFIASHSYIDSNVTAFISNISLFFRLATTTRSLCSHIHVITHLFYKF